MSEPRDPFKNTWMCKLTL